MNKLFAITLGMLSLSGAINAAVELKVCCGEEKVTLPIRSGERYALLNGQTEDGQLVAIHVELMQETESGATIRFYTLTGKDDSQEVNQLVGECDFTFDEALREINFDNPVTPSPIVMGFAVCRCLAPAMDAASDMELCNVTQECREMCQQSCTDQLSDCK